MAGILQTQEIQLLNKDFNAPEKFQAIISIIAKRLKEHPKAIYQMPEK